MRVNTLVVLVALVIGNYSLSLKAAEAVKAVKATSESNNWQNIMDADEAAFRLGKFDDAVEFHCSSYTSARPDTSILVSETI
jgi:hypothetical protein